MLRYLICFNGKSCKYNVSSTSSNRRKKSLKYYVTKLFSSNPSLTTNVDAIENQSCIVPYFSQHYFSLNVFKRDSSVINDGGNVNVNEAQPSDIYFSSQNYFQQDILNPDLSLINGDANVAELQQNIIPFSGDTINTGVNEIQIQPDVIPSTSKNCIPSDSLVNDHLIINTAAALGQNSIIPFSSQDYFPLDVLKWMKANADFQAQYKLMQICKYFMYKNFPFFVVKDVRILDVIFRGIIINYNTFNGNHHEHKLCELPNNVLITGDLRIYGINFYPLKEKTVVYDIHKLRLEDTTLTYYEYELLVSSKKVKELNLISTSINYCNHNNMLVHLNRILTHLKNIERIKITNNVPSFSSRNAAHHTILPKLKSFKICEISKKFNIKAFFVFMNNHRQAEFSIINFTRILPLEYLMEYEYFAAEIKSIFCKHRKPIFKYCGRTL